MNESAGFPVFDLTRWNEGGDLIPGFALISDGDASGSTYAHWLVSRTDRRTYKSDQSGIIYIGHVELAANLDSASHQLLAKSFSGQPLTIPGDRPPAGFARKVLGRLGAAIFPVVLAQSGSYCCEEQCKLSCVAEKTCGTECHCLTNDGDCCNTGAINSCIWCCHAGCWLQCGDWRCCTCVSNCL